MLAADLRTHPCQKAEVPVMRRSLLALVAARVGTGSSAGQFLPGVAYRMIYGYQAR
jgi:hypothetical protein